MQDSCVCLEAYPRNATVATTDTAPTTNANRDWKQHATIQAGEGPPGASQNAEPSHGGGVD